MSTFKKVLIPTDFSENARHAFKFAKENFESPETTFILLHTYKLRHYGAIVSADLDNILKEDSERDMQSEVEWVKTHFPKIRLEHYLYQGLTADIVSSFADQNSVDVIVMGTKGVTNAMGAFLGSNASNAIKLIKKPLIVVPASADIHPMNKIVFAMDGRKIPTFDSISPLRSMVKMTGAQLDILHILEPSDKTNVIDQEELKLDTVFSDTDHQFHFLEQGNTTIGERIIDFSNQRKCDLVAVMARSYGFLEGLFHKSVTRKLSLHSTIPLLIFHEVRSK